MPPITVAATLCILSGISSAMHLQTANYHWFEIGRLAAFLGAYALFLWHKRRVNRNHFLMIALVLIAWCLAQSTAYMATRAIMSMAPIP